MWIWSYSPKSSKCQILNSIVLIINTSNTFYKDIIFDLAVEPGTWNQELSYFLNLLMEFFSTIFKKEPIKITVPLPAHHNFSAWYLYHLPNRPWSIWDSIIRVYWKTPKEFNFNNLRCKRRLLPTCRSIPKWVE